MERLLIYEPARRRIAADLARFASVLQIVAMDETGALSLDGSRISAEEAAPTIAWPNHAVFTSPVARDYSVAMLKASGLKWVQSAAAGFDHPIFSQLVKAGARLTTSHGQAVGMADYVVAGVLDHFQRGPERREAQSARDWRRLQVREVLDSRWLIIGFGAVGQAVAVRGRAFGAHITGVRRNQSPHPAADEIVAPAAVLASLPAADVVVLCAPLDAATRHMANSAFFGAMKAGSVLVNVGRGGLVDEAALLAALDAGTPSRAVLDVFETEPLPPDSPFWAHPRVSVTAHVSGVANGQDDRNEALFLDNLERFLGGRPLLGEIDRRDVLGAAD